MQRDKNGGDNDDVASEAGSVSDTEFDAYLSKTEVDGADANEDYSDWKDLDFAE
jgi:hypothetical protein